MLSSPSSLAVSSSSSSSSLLPQPPRLRRIAVSVGPRLVILVFVSVVVVFFVVVFVFVAVAAVAVFVASVFIVLLACGVFLMVFFLVVLDATGASQYGRGNQLSYTWVTSEKAQSSPPPAPHPPISMLT